MDTRPGKTAGGLRVLTFTSLFPNTEQRLHGLFVRERIRALARLCDLRVVAPVPWSPDLPGMPERHRQYARVARHEVQVGMSVAHPRFAVLPGLMKPADGLLMGAFCALPVRRLQRAFDFDVIDAHWAYPDGVAAALLARWTGRPVAITVRGDDINVFGREPGRRPLIRWSLRSAGLVIALSSMLRDAVLDLTDGQARVAVIPNGVDAARFSPTSRDEARRKLGIPADARLVVSAGRLHQSKGFPTLVAAVGRLRARFPALRVAIVGAADREADATEGILAAAELNGLGDRLILPGEQAPDTLRLWYGAADLFALPTSREGSPNVILEALACGLPCVASPVGGIPDVLCDPRLGVLADPTAMAFADGLAAALDRKWDRGLIARLGGRRTWDVVASECFAHLSALAGRPAADAAAQRIPA
jgi:glycosyltransferase involved in cell wall biosynthesis